MRFVTRAVIGVAGLGMVATVASVAGTAGGAGATASGTVRTTSGAALTLRAQATSNSAALASVGSGTHISISCQTSGQRVSGKYGTSSVWDRTRFDGRTGYVSDAFVYTGSDGRVARDCATPTKPPTGSVSAKVKAVIAAAQSQVGRDYSYSWGAGGKSGPGYGVCCSPSGYNDTHRFGYDCSGLTQYAFWKGAHIDIGGWTGPQWSSGKKIPYRDRRPGDLLFWGSGNATTHVAIYIGGGKMIEAAPPRGTHSVHVTNVYGTHSVVIRVIG